MYCDDRAFFMDKSELYLCKIKSHYGKYFIYCMKHYSSRKAILPSISCTANLLRGHEVIRQKLLENCLRE